MALGRRCRGCGATDHGEVQPATPEDRSRWRISTSHAGDVVAVAVADCAGVAVDVGLDVELVARTDPDVAPLVMGDGERSRRPEPTRWDLCGLWTAKEAVLKALGCGLHVAMTELEVSHPRDGGPGAGEWVVRPVGDDPQLQPLRERPCRLVDLTSTVDGPGGAQRAALAVIGADRVRLEHHRATPARWRSWTESLLDDR